MKEQFIPCPVCQTSIPFEVQALLKGASFACPKCLASISLAPTSAPQVGEVMEKLENLKKEQPKKNKI